MSPVLGFWILRKSVFSLKITIFLKPKINKNLTSNYATQQIEIPFN